MSIPLCNRRGFTLMELLVVVAVIGLIMGLGIGVVQVTFDLELEKVARELSSTMRYLYGEAARSGEIHRLVIDLDEERYWVESAPNSPEVLEQLAREKIPDTAGNPEENEVKESDLKNEGTEGNASTEPAAAPTGFTPLEDGVLRQREIKPVVFKDVFVSHLELRQEEGRVSIYFFPVGATEYAIINLSDEEESVFYSIELNPLTGKTKLRNEYYESAY